MWTKLWSIGSFQIKTTSYYPERSSNNFLVQKHTCLLYQNPNTFLPTWRECMFCFCRLLRNPSPREARRLFFIRQRAMIYSCHKALFLASLFSFAHFSTLCNFSGDLAASSSVLFISSLESPRSIFLRAQSKLCGTKRMQDEICFTDTLYLVEFVISAWSPFSLSSFASSFLFALSTHLSIPHHLAHSLKSGDSLMAQTFSRFSFLLRSFLFSKSKRHESKQYT